jgi:Domain of unknown function (DUF4440)
MKKVYLLFFLCVHFLVNAQNNKDENKVLQLSNRKFDWMICKNLDSLEWLLHQDLLYIHSNGWTQTKTEVLEDFRSGKLSLEKIAIKKQNARAFKNTIIINGLGTFSGKMNNNSFLAELLFTEVYILENSHWQLVSRHANKMQ